MSPSKKPQSELKRARNTIRSLKELLRRKLIEIEQLKAARQADVEKIAQLEEEKEAERLKRWLNERYPSRHSGSFTIVGGWRKTPIFAAEYDLQDVLGELEKADLRNLAIKRVLTKKGIKSSSSAMRKLRGSQEVEAEGTAILSDSDALRELALQRVVHLLALQWLRENLKKLMTHAFWTIVMASKFAAKKYGYECAGQVYLGATEIDEGLSVFTEEVKAAIGVNPSGGRRKNAKTTPKQNVEDRKSIIENRELMTLRAMLDLLTNDPDCSLTVRRVAKRIQDSGLPLGMSHDKLDRWKREFDYKSLITIAEHMRADGLAPENADLEVLRKYKQKRAQKS